MRNFYTKAFKTDAILKVIKQDLSVEKVAKEIDVPVSTLYKWLAKYRHAKQLSQTPANTDKQSNYIKNLQLENDILKKALFLPQKKEAIFEFIYENKDNFPVQRLCSLLDVSSSGYYKYIKSIPSKQALKHNQITRLVRDVYITHGPNIGSPTITEIINSNEYVTSQATVARILSANRKTWHASFSKFHNNKDVVLHFNNKDTVLDSENNTYYHEELGQEQIEAFLNNIYFNNFRKYKGNTNTKVQTFSKNDNLLIHGDNLHALHLLKSTFANSVQLIYIDVPYRTMRSNLSYHDSSSRSDYLLLLKNRLEMAQELLKSSGLIFIHCDDNEQAYIKVLCDEIFGEDNFVNQIIWRRTNGQQNRGHIARVKDYILVYAKNKKYLSLNRPSLSENQLKSYKYTDCKGKYRTDKILNKRNGYYTYTIETPGGTIHHNKWNYSQASFQNLLDSDAIHWSQNYIPYKKAYLDDNPTRVINDLWVTDEYGTTREATIELQLVIGQNHFTYPKPTKLLKHIIKLASNENDIVLDFFAGSGTTAVAAAQLNRQSIAVEIQQQNFNIMIERLLKSDIKDLSFVTSFIDKKED